MSKPLIKIFTYVDGVNDTPFPNEENQLIIPEYSFSESRMGSVNLTATAMYPTCLDDKWVTGKQYADFRGERYFIVKTPSSSKSNDDVRYKHDIEFVSERNILETIYFYDVVSDNTSVDRYVSNSTKVLFYGDVHELVARLNYSLEYSQVAYRLVVDAGITSEVKQVSLEDVFVFDAIQEIFNIFELPFYFVGKTCHVGFTDNAITHTFRYGKDYELLSINKTNANYKITNRVTGTGSSDNIQFYYPNPSNDRAAIEAAGGKWITPASTLMPPIYRDTDGAERFYNAINKRYINPETGEYYVFENEFTTASQKEQIVTFEDIKPTIKNTLNAAGLRIDEIIDVAFDKDDNDEVDESTGDYVHSYFYVKLNRFSGDYGFNLFEQPIVGSDASIVMTSGNCNACTFQIGVIEVEEDGKTVFKNPVQVDKNGNIAEGNYADKVKPNNIQERQQDTTQNEVWIALKKDNTTFGMVMPNKNGNIRPSYGDSFVIINIDMPQTYIYKAENELEEAILKYMANNNSEKFTFSIKLSRIFLAENPAVEALINSSARIDLEYNGKYHQLYVSSYTYRSDSEVLPEITIELADTLTISKNSIQTSIDSVKQDIMNTIGGVDFLKQGLKYFLRKDTEDIARFFISFLRGIKIGNYVSGGDIGGIFAVDGNGKTFIETDFLKVRMKAYFETLEIINTGSIAGRQIITPGGSIKCIKVVDREEIINEDGEKEEKIWNFYRCYFLAEQDGVKVENRFRKNDQALSQDFNIKEGVYENVSNHYYWRLVVGVGDDYIDLSKTDADTNSDAPAIGDVICQLGHRDNKVPERQNAMIFSAVDLYSPSLTMYAGINSYSYVNKDYISYGVDKTTNKAFMNVYGDTYIGDRNRTSYMEFKTGKGLKIKGQLEVGSTIGNGSTIEDALDKATQDAIDAATEDLTNYAKEVTESLNNIQYQIDGQIESFFEKYSPTLTNKPAVDWTTEELKKQHANDTFTNIDTGESWKWVKDGTTWKWSVIEDTATLKALAAASKAQDTADGKRRVFVAKPTNEQVYDVGDLWVNATYGTTYHNDILRAKTAKKAGEAFNISHWELASKYTDDTKANEAAAAAAAAQEAAEQAATAVDNLNTYVDGAFKDGVIEESEAQAIEKYINIVDNAKKTTDAAYTKLYANTYLTGAAKTGLKSAKDKLDIATTNLINSINAAIADGQTTVAEKNDVDAKFAAYNTANEAFSTAVEVANGAIQDLLKSYSDQAKEAAVAAQAAADAAQAAADSASDAVDDLNGYVDGAFKDGVIDEAEAKAIEKYINVVNGSKAATDATYTKLYSNKYLLGTAKENLKTAKDKLDVATTALLTSIQSAIADGKTTAEEKAAVDAKYADFNKANEDFNTAIEAANLSIQNMLKSYADAALAAAEAAQSSADAAKTAADNAAGAVGDLNDYVDGAFKDGIIDASEAQAIEKYINIVNNTKGEVKATFDKLYANVYLTGAAKTGLNSSYTALNTAITNLLNSINTAIADGKTTEAEKSDVDLKYTSFNTAYASFNTAVETANKAIQDKLKTFADDAKALAESAQAVADAAKDRLDSWAEDGVISPTEKQGIKDEIARIKADKDNITAGYKLYNLGEATAYITAYTDYYNSLLALSDTTKETIEIPTDFATKQTKYYTERTAALNAIASASKSAVDAAQAAADAAKSRLDSWAADGVISPAEKQSIKDERARILADKADITTGYTRYNLGTPTDYNTAYTAYDTALAALSKDTPEVITIPSDFATKQKNYYTKRTAAISAIDAATKSNADAAAAAAAKAQEAAEQAATAVDNLNTYVDGAFKDGVIEESEAQAIEKYINIVDNAKKTTDAAYTKLYANTYLTGAAKTGLKSAKDKLDIATTNLINSINAAIADGQTTVAEKNDVDAKFAAYNTANEAFSTAVEVANGAIQDLLKSYSDQAKEAAVAAQAAADAAQAAADSASDAVDDLNGYVDGAFKDGVIDEAEAKAIEKYINVVNGSKAATDATYTKLYSNKYLLGTAKENLKTAKDKLDVATTALLTSIQSAIADGKTTAEEKAAVDAKYADFNKANEDFNTAIEAANLSIQNMLKSYADAALAAAEAAQSSADAAKTAADNAAGAVGDLNDYVDGAFKDGIIDASEAQAIEKYINIVNNTKGEVKATFDKLYANVYLTGAAKTGLNSSYTALNTAITNLLNSINTAIADGKTTEAEKSDVDLKYTSFNTAYASFNTAVETANKAIQDKLKTFADDAKALAESAQAVADAAKDRLDSWAEDGVISPTEKQGIKDEIARIKADKDNITAGYKLYNLGEATAYITAYTDYYNSLLALSDTTKETIEIPTDFATKQTKYYTERTAALNAIASASKSAVDAAQAAADAAKSRLDSWAADGVISPAEKQSIKDERARILADKADITTGYTRYNLGTPTDYNTAYTAYDTALAALSKDTPEVITIPSDFATKQKNYYTKRTAAISAIDAATKSNADAAAAAAAKAQEDIDSVKTDINKINSDVAGLKNFTDDAFADGVVDRGEASAIGAYLKSIATVKADVDKSYTEVYANPLLAGTAKTTLNTTYTAFGKAVEELTTVIEAVVEKGIADATDRASVNGKYDAFNTKYGDFVKALNAANTYIQDQIDSKAENALTEAVSYRYLKKAFSEYTIIEGGLVQNSLNVLGCTNDKKEFVVQAGMSGLYDASATGGGIAAWYGGSMKDYFDYTDLDRPKDVAKGVDRMDGTGYRANGNLWWDLNGKVHADPLSFFVGEATVGGLLASFQVVMTNNKPDYLIPKVPFQDLTISNNLTVGGDIILKDGILKWDAANNAFYVEKKDGSIASFYATGEVSAGGVGSGGSGGGGGLIENVYGYSNLNGEYKDTDLNNTFNAYTIAQINKRVVSLEGGSALTVTTTGSGNAVTSVAKSGTAITVTKGTTFVDTTSTQTIGGTKTFSSSILMGRSALHFVNSSTSSNATGLYWKTANYAANQFGIGCSTINNASPRGFIGWTSEPWATSNNLTVSETQLTYKAKNILHAGNYNDYAPTKTGGGASGSWGISITGNAATATTANRLVNIGGVNWTTLADATGNGVRSYTDTTTEGRWMSYGTVLQISNVNNPDPGVNGHWLTQILSSTSNLLGVRWRTNTGAWSGVQTIVTSGNYTSLITKLGTATVGSNTKFFYLNAGTPTASNASIGTGTHPIYLNGGVFTASTSTVGSASRGIYMTGGLLTAMSATVGSASLPVYMNEGTITQCSTTLGVSITGTAPRLTTTELTNQDLNSYTYTNYSGKLYYAGGSNTTTNVPSGVGAYGLMVWRIATGYTGHLMFDSAGDFRARFHNGTTWSAWDKLAYITDNVASATKLQTARTINGTSFNGTANITTAKWGTARTLAIAAASKSIDGSTNITISRADMNVSAGNESIFTGTTVANTWYRIASSPVNISSITGIFSIYASASKYHTNCLLTVSTSYGTTASTSIQQLSCAHYGNPLITQARIVYHTTYDAHYAYLEILVPTAITSTFVVRFSLPGQNFWALNTSLVAGSIPSGYTSKAITLKNSCIVADVTGNLTGNVTGNLTGNAATATTANRLVNIGGVNWTTLADATGNGVRSYTDTTTEGRWMSYGTVLQISNVNNPDPGVNGHWLTQILSSTSNLLGVRWRTNTGAWSGVQTIVTSGNYTSLITKLGTATVGSNTKFFYLNAGTPTASNASIGTGTHPIYLNGGVFTASTSTVGSASRGIYMTGGLLTAMSATVGSASLPVYMNEGTITQCSTTLGVSITGTAPRLTTTELTNQDLNSYTYTNYSGKLYYAGGSNTTTNVPSGVGAYGLMVWRIATGYTGHLMFDSAGDFRARFHNGTTWSAWDKLAYITDNVASATKLQTARTINGTSFNGTANITTAKWGTARTLAIAAASKSIDGSTNITISRADMNVSAGNESIFTGTTVANTWYRIASSPVNISSITGIFSIYASASKYHTNCLLTVSTSYGTTASTSIQQLSCAHYGNPLITQARIVYHTTYDAHYAYLEILVPTAITSTFVVRFSLPGQNFWALNTSLVAGSIPSGYTSKAITLKNSCIVADVTGNLTGNVTGNLTGNASTATSLQTARTLWGQSFNGTANITGTLLGVESVIAKSGRFNNFLAYYDTTATTVTGTICITLPNGWTSSMNTYEILIYEHNTTANASVITIGGYNYNGGGTASSAKWINIGYHTKGSYSKGVRLAYNGSKCVILLGTTTTTWSYPKVYLKTVYTGFNSQTIWGGTSTISLITSETGYTNIVSAGRMDEFFGDTSVTGRLAVSGATTLDSTLTVASTGLFNLSTDATSTTAAAVRIVGGLAVGKQLRVGGAVTLSSTLSVSSTLNVSGVVNANNATDATSTTAASLVCDGGVGIVKQLRVGGATTLSSTLSASGVVSFTNATDATSTTAAAVKVTGGLGVAKQLRVGSNAVFTKGIYINGNTTGDESITLGTSGDKRIKMGAGGFPGTRWSEIAFFPNFANNGGFTDINFLIQAEGTIQISSQAKFVWISGGNIAASGEVSAGSTSDRNLKKNFSLEDYQQRVLDLGMVQDFEYREEEMKRAVRTYKPGRHTSLIAQDIKSCTSMVSKDKDGYLKINPLDKEFLFTVVGAVQLNVLGLREVKSEVEILKDEIRELKKRIEYLESLK